MIDVVAVSFNNTIDYVSCGDLSLKRGNFVIIECDNGVQMARAINDSYKEKEENLALPLKGVLRIATEDDLKKADDNQKIADKALLDARKFSANLLLNMNFIGAFYNFDRSQLLFYFLADERVDFRDLAKKLAQKYKTRIELRQIGVRDKAKKIGGLGPCGLFLCCNSFLTDLGSVSINMAKNQFLALNPGKINGVCGRLLCCLEYENDLYTELKRDMPKVGSFVETEHGLGNVVSVDIFKKNYSVDLNDRGIVVFSKDSNNGSN